MFVNNFNDLTFSLETCDDFENRFNLFHLLDKNIDPEIISNFTKDIKFVLLNTLKWSSIKFEKKRNNSRLSLFYKYGEFDYNNPLLSEIKNLDFTDKQNLIIYLEKLINEYEKIQITLHIYNLINMKNLFGIQFIKNQSYCISFNPFILDKKKYITEGYYFDKISYILEMAKSNLIYYAKYIKDSYLSIYDISYKLLLKSYNIDIEYHNVNPLYTTNETKTKYKGLFDKSKIFYYYVNSNLYSANNYNFYEKYNNLINPQVKMKYKKIEI